MSDNEDQRVDLKPSNKLRNTFFVTGGIVFGILMSFVFFSIGYNNRNTIVIREKEEVSEIKKVECVEWRLSYE
jgi:hypothetical protein